MPGPEASELTDVASSAGEGSALLEVTALRAGYGPIMAVREVSLSVDPGQIVALVGANGAGKTTFCGSIAGLVPSAGGSVRFADREMSSLPAHQRVRSGMALVPEGRRIFNALTVAENLQLASGSRRVSEERQSVLDLFPILAKRLHHAAGGLSGGEQQQLAIGRALLSKPRLLILDEPTLGLAPRLVGAILELIGQLRHDRGLAILVVDQHVHDTLAVADRAYVMRTGEVVMQGPSDDVRASDELEAHLLGRQPKRREP